MADTIVRKVIMQLTADDADAAAKLEAIKAKADELRNANPELKVKIDSAEAAAKMAVFRQELKDAATVDVDDAAAKAKIDELKLKLDILKAQRNDVKIGVDATRAELEIATLEAELDKIGNKKTDPGANAGGFAASWQLWAVAIAAVGAALPVIPAALAAVAAAAAPVVLAVMGVSKALQDGSAAAQQAGQTSAQLAQTEFSNAQAIASAQQAIRDAKTQAAHDIITSDQQIQNAEQSLAGAQRTAAQDAISNAESVARAEQGLANAQQSEENAQRNLTQARQDAVRTLQSLDNQVKDTALGEQQAAIDLRQAQADQARIDALATSTQLEKDQAALRVAEAQQRLTEAQQAATNATADNNKAQQEGVDGLPAVVSAQQAVAAAAQGTANAQQALADAQRAQADQAQQDAERIANATQNLSSVQQQAAWQQQRDAEAVQKAVDNLASTYKQQQLAAQTAAASGSNASASFAKDMAGMSLPGQQVVNMLLQMKGGLKDLENSATTAIAPGFLTFLQGVQSIMPQVQGEIQTMGGIIGQAFADIGRALKDPVIRGELKAIFDEGNKIVTILLPPLENFFGQFLKMGASSGSAASGFATGIGAILNGFAQLFTQLSDPKTSKAIGQVFQAIGQVIGDLGGPLGQVIGMIAQVLGPLMIGLEPVIHRVADAIGSMAGPVSTALQPLIGSLVQLFTQVIIPNLPALTNLSIAFAQLGIALVPLATALIQILNQVLVPMMPLITQTLTGLAGGIGLITRFATDAVNAVVGIFSNIPGFFTGMYEFMISAGYNLIVGIWNGIVRGFNQFISGISSLGKTIGNALLGWAGIHFNSPPSEAVYMVMAGHRLNEGLSKGLNESQSAVSAAMARTDHAISAGTAAPAVQRVQLEFVGNANDQLFQLFKRNIRVRGGNVQIVGA